jgi:hypothetical protein
MILMMIIIMIRAGRIIIINDSVSSSDSSSTSSSSSDDTSRVSSSNSTTSRMSFRAPQDLIVILQCMIGSKVSIENVWGHCFQTQTPFVCRTWSLSVTCLPVYHENNADCKVTTPFFDSGRGPLRLKMHDRNLRPLSKR